MKPLLLTLTALLTLAGCRSVEKMIDQGDYDSLIQLSIKRLTGKKKKDIYVMALEQAFDRATRRDMARVESLRQENRAESWERIISVANGMDRRQRRIEPLLPLVSEDGYQAKFSFVKTDLIIREARDRAANLYAGKLDVLVGQARNGDKSAAREAYEIIHHLREFDTNLDNGQLREEMRDLGTNHILLALDNATRSILPPGMTQELLAPNVSGQSDTWSRYYSNEDARRAFDYLARLTIVEVAVSAEGWREHPENVSREIKDGWEYVLDDRGNVKKDSLGNDIKRDRYITVKATLVETFQDKAALVAARVDVTDLSNQAVVLSRPIQFEERFSHVARQFYGDERALDNNQRKRIPPVSYPADTDMLTSALMGLKPLFFAQVRRAPFR